VGLGGVEQPEAALDLGDGVEQLGAHLGLGGELGLDAPGAGGEDLLGRHRLALAAAGVGGAEDRQQEGLDPLGPARLGAGHLRRWCRGRR
jgi:hypothetical protein